ncbi:mucin-5B-like [Lissotriton helveticus]
MQLYIQIDPSFQRKLCGLCGNFNNIQGDEFTGSSGMVEGTAAAFGNSWKVYPQCPDVKNIFDDPCLINSEKGCKPPQIFFNCSSAPPGASGSECQKSCQNLGVSCISRQCISGCMCPNGMALNGSSGCVPIEQCPCIHNGVTYQPGDQIQVSCNTCNCTQRSWACTNRVCLGSCTTYGEGNYVSFDNRRFRFSGNCEYILSQDYCSSSTQEGTYSVIIENVPCSSSGMTCAKALKLSLGSYRFTFSDAQFTVVDTTIGQRIPYKIRYMGIYLVVEGSNGMILLWDKKTTIFVKLTTAFTGAVCGLCGNFDGNSLNDFTTRSHSVVEGVAEFGNSWKFSASCGDVPPPPVPCADNAPRRFWAQQQCNIILSVTFSDCHRQIDPVPYYDICVGDACACDTGGDCECFCTAVAAYAQACSDTGICVYWRSPEICPLFCDYFNKHEGCDWHYQPCGAPCMKTCRNPTGECLYVLPALEGCYPKCPDERPYYDEDKKQCVEICGCYDDEGNRYELGEKVDLCESCQACNCTMNGIKCAYDIQACFCVYDGKVYKYNEVIYTTTGEMGKCTNMTCGADGNIVAVVYLCLTTAMTTASTQTDLHKMADRVKEVEIVAKSLVTDMSELQTKVSQLKKENAALADKLDDQEGRARRNNVRIIGLPESEGKQAMDLYVEELIKTELKPKGLSNFFTVERAHRVPGGKPKPGAPPRPVLACLFNFRDGDAILQAARTSPPVSIHNSNITFFPDYTAAVSQRRRNFQEVKRELRSRELPYSMLFPARLRVVADGRAWFFETPEAAQDWIDGWRQVGNNSRGTRQLHRREGQDWPDSQQTERPTPGHSPGHEE